MIYNRDGLFTETNTIQIYMKECSVHSVRLALMRAYHVEVLHVCLLVLGVIATTTALPLWCNSINVASTTYVYRQTAELSPNELKGDCEKYLEPTRNGAAFVEVVMRRADKNRDGSLSRAEVTHAWNKLQIVAKKLAEAFCMDDTAMFNKCDADRNGIISAYELAFVNGCFDSCHARKRVFQYLS